MAATATAREISAVSPVICVTADHCARTSDAPQQCTYTIRFADSAASIVSRISCILSGDCGTLTSRIGNDQKESWGSSVKGADIRILTLRYRNGVRLITAALAAT